MDPICNCLTLACGFVTPTVCDHHAHGISSQFAVDAPTDPPRAPGKAAKLRRLKAPG